MDTLRSQNADQEFYEVLFPELFMDAVLALDIPPFDYLLVDEAQDLLSETYLDVFDLLLKGGMRQGNWTFFMDPLQDIFGRYEHAIYQRLESYGFARFPLTRNCRNTRPVAMQAALISEIDVPIWGSVEGGQVQRTFYSSKEQLCRELTTRIENWRKEGITPSEMIILSPVALERSDLAGITRLGSLALYDLAKEQRKSGIAYCTMQAFKGLERKCVFIVDMPDIRKDHKLYYCGLTRARVAMTIFWRESEKDLYDDLSKRFGGRMPKLMDQLE